MVLSCCFLTGRAEHQTSVFHLPLAHPAVVSGVPPARRHPDLGHLVFWQGAFPLPDLGLLRHADVSVWHRLLARLLHWCSFFSGSFGPFWLFADWSGRTCWLETSQWTWGYCRYSSSGSAAEPPQMFQRIFVLITPDQSLTHGLLTSHVPHVSGLSHLRCPHHPNQGWRAAGQLLTCWRTCLLGAWAAKRLKHGGFDEWRSWTEARLLSTVQEPLHLPGSCTDEHTSADALKEKPESLPYRDPDFVLAAACLVCMFCCLSADLELLLKVSPLMMWRSQYFWYFVYENQNSELSFIWHTSHLRIRSFTCFIILFI